VHEYFADDPSISLYFLDQFKIFVTPEPIGFRLDFRFPVGETLLEFSRRFLERSDVETVDTRPAHLNLGILRHIDQHSAETNRFRFLGKVRNLAFVATGYVVFVLDLADSPGGGYSGKQNSTQ